MSVELFRTTISIPPSDRKLSYSSGSILLGSCFTENIGNKLIGYKFPAILNPFGIIYNPLSVKSSLERIIKGNPYSSDSLQYSNGLYYSFDHHSRFSDPNAEVCLNGINKALSNANDAIKKASFLFITFGTAYYYKIKLSKQIVSNCHKLPEKEFERQRLTVTEIVENLAKIITSLRGLYPNLQIVFTVSPIRHWKDGAHENQLSKSILLLAIDKLCRMYNHLFYFPAYELMLDELRDYRFYTEDMFHPNSTAIDFIWKRFRDCFIAEATSQIMNEVEKIQMAYQHKPYNPQSEAFRSFSIQQLNKIQYLTDQYPHLNFDSENKYFRSFME
jgi:hypothetical protein